MKILELLVLLVTIPTVMVGLPLVMLRAVSVARARRLSGHEVEE